MHYRYTAVLSIVTSFVLTGGAAPVPQGNAELANEQVFTIIPNDKLRSTIRPQIAQHWDYNEDSFHHSINDCKDDGGTYNSICEPGNTAARRSKTHSAAFPGLKYIRSISDSAVEATEENLGADYTFHTSTFKNMNTKREATTKDAKGTSIIESNPKFAGTIYTTDVRDSDDSIQKSDITNKADRGIISITNKVEANHPKTPSRRRKMLLRIRSKNVFEQPEKIEKEIDAAILSSYRDRIKANKCPELSLSSTEKQDYSSCAMHGRDEHTKNTRISRQLIDPTFNASDRSAVEFFPAHLPTPPAGELHHPYRVRPTEKSEFLVSPRPTAVATATDIGTPNPNLPIHPGLPSHFGHGPVLPGIGHHGSAVSDSGSRGGNEENYEVDEAVEET